MRIRTLGALLATLSLAGCVPPPVLDTPYYEEVLSGAPFTRLVIEIDHAPGYRPSDAAITHLKLTLTNVTSKSEVDVRLDATLAADANERWTSEELLAKEESTRSTPQAEPTAVLHVLYPAGRFEREGVAGVTIAGTGIGPVVVFLDTLRELGTQLGPIPLAPGAVERLERATLLHEAGHAIGLVNNGLPQVRDREDKEHEGHSNNTQSVMYWRVESVDGLREYLLRESRVPSEFDDDDRNDLRGAGGR